MNELPNPGVYADHRVTLCGIVSPGDQRGRRLGFPTANIALPMDAAVSDGVWTGWVKVPGSGWNLAAISIGRRPTYYSATGVRLLEAHLIGFVGDLYGVTVEVELGEQLRPQRAFACSEELVEAIRHDIRLTLAWAEGAGIRTLPVRLRGRRRWAGSKHRAESNRRRIEERRRKYLTKIAHSIFDLVSEDGSVSHASVAERTRIPVEYLKYSYPDVDALVGVARRHVAQHHSGKAVTR